MIHLNSLIRERKSHLINRLQYLQTRLEHECSAQVYQLVLDGISLIYSHFQRVDEISALIEKIPASVNDPALGVNLCVPFYNQIFSRLQEIEAVVEVLDDVWGNYVTSESFSKKFSELYQVFSKFCDEISVPLGAHFNMILPGNCFMYSRFPTVARNLFRTFVPISAIQNPYVWPILAHEIGHAFSFIPNIEELIEAECGPLISQHLRSIRERVQRSREEIADIEYILSRSWYQWVSEIWADLFALRRVGPCFVDSEMFELITSDPFSPSMEASGRLYIFSHPPPDVRIKILVHNSNQWFPQLTNHVSNCQKLWDEMISSRTSQTLEEHREWFDLLCDNQLLQPMEQRVVALLDQLVPLQNVTSSSLETVMSTQPISVTSALSSLVCEGGTCGHFIEKLAQKIRLAT